MNTKEKVMEASQVIQRIAEVANAMARQAGEPGLEIAGMIVSCLASRPELANDFMEKGADLFIDGDLDFQPAKCSTYPRLTSNTERVAVHQ